MVCSSLQLGDPEWDLVSRGLREQKCAGDFDFEHIDYNRDALPASVPEDYCNIYPVLAVTVLGVTALKM